MALKNTGINIELREVKLADLPSELLAISGEKTVPVLALTDGMVLSESWDIVKWALAQHDPDNWLGKDNEHLLDAEILIETNDFSFKNDLDHYKYAVGYPEHSEAHYRQSCEVFIEEIEDMLSDQTYLLSNQISLADMGVFPFIRQFSLVDTDWFDAAPYPKVQAWLQSLIATELFQQVFQKHALWQTGDMTTYI